MKVFIGRDRDNGGIVGVYSTQDIADKMCGKYENVSEHIVDEDVPQDVVVQQDFKIQ